MKLEGEQLLFRIFFKPVTKFAKIIPLHRYLLKKMKEQNIAGATILKGFYGFLGYEDSIYRETFFDSSLVPACIETVDKPQKINTFINAEWQYLKDLILTIERAKVIIYTSSNEDRQNYEDMLSIINEPNISRRSEVMLNELEEMVLIRAFIGDSDREKASNKYLYEFIIEEAKKLDFLLAFSYKGLMGFGKKARLRDTETIEFSSNIPICVEIIGDDEKTTKMLALLNEHVESGLVTTEKVTVYKKTLKKEGKHNE